MTGPERSLPNAREAGVAGPRVAGPRPTILVAEDDPVTLDVIQVMLTPLYEVIATESCAETEQAVASARPDAAVLDYQLPDGNALDLLARLQALDPELPVIILTAHGSIDLAVEAMRRGADHFLTKPIEAKLLRGILERCLESRRQRRRERAQKSQTAPQDPFRGTSEAMRALAKKARRVAAADRPVLLVGETGCGKGVLARWLHHHGPRASEPFVELNCAGLRPELLESELFGHRKGAFTSADDDKPGLLEVADRGTLFLDEIGDMERSVQAKLLKVLEEQTFRRLGGVRDKVIDVRLLSATHQRLEEQVRRGSFRRDLYFRINTLVLEIPPLRRRWEDVASLAEYFLENLGREVGRPSLALSPDALQALVQYRWPGNIRELRNVLERAVLLGESQTIDTGDLHFETSLREDFATETLTFSLAELEERHIRRVLEDEDGAVERAARRLGIARSSLYRKIKEYGIDPSRVV